MLEVAPDCRAVAWFGRQFLTGAALFAAQDDVRQFVDVGAGFPTSPSVHETVVKVDSVVRVACINYDPVVFAHTNAMSTGTSGVTPMLADFREPEELIERLRTEAQIDFSRPIALLAVGVLDYVMDDEHPAEIIARFGEVMASGSYMVFTHGSTESDEAFVSQTFTDTVGSTAEAVFRSRFEVEKLFDGFEMLDPGVVPIQEWLGENLPETRLVLLGGVCKL